MRTDNLNFTINNLASTKEPHYVLQISWDSGNTSFLYLTSHTTAEVPSGVDSIYNVIKEISGTSQKIDPINARSTIGSISIQLTDRGELITDKIRSKLEEVDILQATDITFNTNDTITSSTTDLSVFVDKRTITVTGSTNNDGEYTIVGIPTTNSITVAEDITQAESPAAIDIYGSQDGLRGKRIIVWVGFKGLDWSDYVKVQTQIIDKITYLDGTYNIACSDIQREARKDIFDLATTNITSNIGIADTGIPVYDPSGFELLEHGQYYSEDPSLEIGYIKIGEEIISYKNILTTEQSVTGSADISFSGNTITSTSTDLSIFANKQKIIVTNTSSNNRAFNINGTPTTNSITVVEICTAESNTSATITAPKQFYDCTRGKFNTVPEVYEIDTNAQYDKQPEVEEFVYLEMPAPKLAYAILTGNLYNQPGKKLPTKWHLGIDTQYVATSKFTGIGTSLWDPTNDGKGFIVRFVGLTKEDGKKFLEEEIYLLIGCFSPILTDGQLSLQRMQNVFDDIYHAVELTEDNIVSYSDLIHDMNSVYNSFELNWNWDFIEEKFTRHDNLLDNSSITTHGKAKTLVQNFKGLHGYSHTDITLAYHRDTSRDRYAAPPLLLELECLPSLNALEVGDIVRVNLPQIRDYTNNTTGINRTFEVQNVSIDWLTGNVRLSLFGSSQRASLISATQTSIIVEDTFYNSAGTDISSLPEYSGGILTSYSFVGGSTTSSAIFYHTAGTGDLIIAGDTLISDNVQIRVKGLLTINGTINGKGRGLVGAAAGTEAQGNIGGIGKTVSTGGFDVRQGVMSRQVAWYAKETPSIITDSGINQLPVNLYKFESNNIINIPLDLRGTSGGAGGNVFSIYSQGTANGGAGGAGGAGLLIISRGVVINQQGKIDLSGEDGLPGNEPGRKFFYAGSGAGGAPGACLILLDGNTVNEPTNYRFIANLGNSPKQGVTPQEYLNNYSLNALGYFYFSKSWSYNVSLVHSKYEGEYSSESHKNSNWLIRKISEDLTPQEDIKKYTSKASVINITEVANTPQTAGQNLATLEISVTPPSDTNYKSSHIYYKLNTQTEYLDLGIVSGTEEITVALTMDGATYDLKAHPISILNVESPDYVSASHTMQTAAGGVVFSAGNYIKTSVGAGSSGAGVVFNSGGINVYDGTATLVNQFLSSDGSLTAKKGTIAGWTIDATSITAPNTALVHLKGGQTAYNTGIGFWLGEYATDDWRLSIGDPGGDYLTYANGNLTITGAFSGSVTATANILLESSGPFISFTDTDGAGAISKIDGGFNSAGSLRIAADPNNVGASSALYFAVDGVDAITVNGAGNVAVRRAAPNILGADEGVASVLTLHGGSSGGSVAVLELSAHAGNTGSAPPGKIAFIADSNTVQANKELAYISADWEGGTIGNKGGVLRFATKADAGSLVQALVIDSSQGIDFPNVPASSSTAFQISSGATNHFNLNTSSSAIDIGPDSSTNYLLRRGGSSGSLNIFGGAAGANIALFGSSHATQPGLAFIDADIHTFRPANGSGAGLLIIDSTTPKLDFGNATDNPNYNYLGTGNLTIDGAIKVTSTTTSGNYITISNTGIVGVNSVLGTMFNIPNDGYYKTGSDFTFSGFLITTSTTDLSGFANNEWVTISDSAGTPNKWVKRIKTKDSSTQLTMYESVNDITGFTNPINITNIKPVFQSGIIREAVIELYTANVIRTSDTVGDGGASSQGIIINDVGIKGFPSNSSNPNFFLDSTTGKVTALEAEITGGGITLSSGGSLKSAGKTYGDTNAGIFYGYDTSAYKFELYSNNNNYLRFDGQELIVNADLRPRTFIRANTGLIANGWDIIGSVEALADVESHFMIEIMGGYYRPGVVFLNGRWHPTSGEAGGPRFEGHFWQVGSDQTVYEIVFKQVSGRKYDIYCRFEINQFMPVIFFKGDDNIKWIENHINASDPVTGTAALNNMVYDGTHLSIGGAPGYWGAQDIPWFGGYEDSYETRSLIWSDLGAAIIGRNSGELNLTIRTYYGDSTAPNFRCDRDAVGSRLLLGPSYLSFEYSTTATKHAIRTWTTRLAINNDGSIDFGNATENSAFNFLGTGTVNMIGDTLNVGITGATIKIGTAPIANGTGRITFLNTNDNFNWELGHNINSSGTFEITPSTTTGGSTFTMPLFKLAKTAVSFGNTTDNPAFNFLGSGVVTAAAFTNSSTVTNYRNGVTEAIHDDMADATAFDIDANISSTWQSVGPENSSPTHTWTALNNVPSGAKWVQLKVITSITGTGIGSVNAALYARATGSTVTGDPAAITYDVIATDTAETKDAGSIVIVNVPIDSSRRFDLSRSKNGVTSDYTRMHLVGWGI